MRVPLIEDLLTESLPAGSNLLVEFDPRSQWYASSLTMAAGWLKDGGTVMYAVLTQPPDKIRLQLNRLGLDVKELEEKGKLELRDGYTATLGRKSKERFTIDSLKVSDLSILFSKVDRAGERGFTQDTLRMWDSCSALARFNDEKGWIEFELTRRFPRSFQYQSTLINGVMKGVHSDWVYRQLEGAADGVIEFALEEAGKATRNLMRITTMRHVGFNPEWHQLKIDENFEITFEK